MIALVKERDNGGKGKGKGGNIKDREKCMNSKDMFHIKPIGFADELNGEEWRGKLC